MAISESMSRRIRAVFNTFSFWTIVLYNVLALNSLEFANLVAKRLFLKGFPFTTITVMFVTYCLIQLIKERERRQALIDDPDPIPPPAPAPPPPPTDPSSTRTDAQPVDPNKQKAE
ncbi:protein-cysteine N-palmitoyltransferase HHAT-like protein [Carassius carassius]|uniref:protein-cysteine N-palmitoyltransferase HHAT-like protein n=1 Tax=Carassius carassius TaxID=217509 RepID=UPI00286892E0|nr:protein-cysteine N-palmitoyltransferase HHAT-like protein [Carassius carassius]